MVRWWCGCVMCWNYWGCVVFFVAAAAFRVWNFCFMFFCMVLSIVCVCLCVWVVCVSIVGLMVRLLLVWVCNVFIAALVLRYIVLISARSFFFVGLMFGCCWEVVLVVEFLCFLCIFVLYFGLCYLLVMVLEIFARCSRVRLLVIFGFIFCIVWCFKMSVVMSCFFNLCCVFRCIFFLFFWCCWSCVMLVVLLILKVIVIIAEFRRTNIFVEVVLFIFFFRF